MIVNLPFQFSPTVKVTTNDITGMLFNVASSHVATVNNTVNSCLLTEVKNPAQLQTRDHFTLILGYELC